MTKYSAEQINQYVKEMAPHTKHLVGTAMSVLRSDEELLQILANEELAFSVRVYLFALIAEGFSNEDVEKLAKYKDVLEIVVAAKELRKARMKYDSEKESNSEPDERENLISQISLLLDEKLEIILQHDVAEKEQQQSDVSDDVVDGTQGNKGESKTAEQSDGDCQNDTDRLEELIDTAGYSLRGHISFESKKLMEEILAVERSVEGAKMIFFGRRKAAPVKDTGSLCGHGKNGQAGKEKDNAELTGAEYAVWCLQNMHDLSLKQCDIIYHAALDKKFNYEEIRSLLYDSDEKTRNEGEMAEQYERLIYKRKHAWKLEKDLAREENDRKIEMKTNWDS